MYAPKCPAHGVPLYLNLYKIIQIRIMYAHVDQDSMINCIVSHICLFLGMSVPNCPEHHATHGMRDGTHARDPRLSAPTVSIPQLLLRLF